MLLQRLGRGVFPKHILGFGFKGRELVAGWATLRLIFLRFVLGSFFSPSFIINNMARFVFSFVFSTGTCFQQLPRFVFRFVFGYPCSFLLYLNDFFGSFFKITSFFVPFIPKKPEH